MPKYKPGQIVTLKYSNIRYVCRVIKTPFGCARCSFFVRNCPPLCTEHCYDKIGPCVFKLIRKYVVEEKERSNTSTKD